MKNKDNSIIIAMFLITVTLLLIAGETLMDEGHWFYKVNFGLMSLMFVLAIYFTLQEIWSVKDE